MNLLALRDQFWADAQDRAQPHLFAQEDVDGWLNEAQDEAAIRASLLHESENPLVCTIAIDAGGTIYQLHQAVLRITRATFTADGTSRATELRIIDRVELDRIRPSWRDDTELCYLIVQDASVRLGCAAGPVGTISLEAYRLPLTPMTGDDDEPEIAGTHHRQLVHWALFRGFGQPDNDLFDPNRSAKAAEAFERYFGARPQADRMRPSEERPQVNKAW